MLALVATLAAPASAQLVPSYGEDRAGTSGFQFLKVPVDPRGVALGGTAVATADDASALFWNPALASQAGNTVVGASTLQYVADVRMNYAAVIRRVGPVSVGVHVQTLDSGEMEVTDEFSGPSGTGQTFAFNAFAAGLTVSQSLTDQFSYGVTAKFARESAVELSSSTALLDLGVQYRIGSTGAVLGVAIRNFGLNGSLSGEIDRNTPDGGVATETDFEGIVPPTLLTIGASYQPFQTGDLRGLTVAGQLTSPSDNAERLNLGAEYVWNDLLALRTGYEFGADEASAPSVGVGVFVPGFGTRRFRADYAYSQLERLGATHRIGINVSL